MEGERLREKRHSGGGRQAWLHAAGGAERGSESDSGGREVAERGALGAVGRGHGRGQWDRDRMGELVSRKRSLWGGQCCHWEGRGAGGDIQSVLPGPAEGGKPSLQSTPRRAEIRLMFPDVPQAGPSELLKKEWV